MRNICKDETEFFRTLLESLRGSDSEYCERYAKFEDVPKLEWLEELDRYMSDIVNGPGIFDGRNIDVGFENVDMTEGYTNGMHGVYRLDSGEFFCAFDCGGDWEIPVNAILYVEDGKIKFYAPVKGNVFCVEHMCAYGSEPDAYDIYEDVPVEDVHGNEPIDIALEFKDIEEFLHGRSKLDAEQER